MLRQNVQNLSSKRWIYIGPRYKQNIDLISFTRGVHLRKQSRLLPLFCVRSDATVTFRCTYISCLSIPSQLRPPALSFAVQVWHHDHCQRVPTHVLVFLVRLRALATVYLSAYPWRSGKGEGACDWKLGQVQPATPKKTALGCCWNCETRSRVRVNSSAQPLTLDGHVMGHVIQRSHVFGWTSSAW